METLITKKPSGNSNQRRRAWRKFREKYEALGYKVVRKKNLVTKANHINTLFVAKLST